MFGCDYDISEIGYNVHCAIDALSSIIKGHMVGTNMEMKTLHFLWHSLSLESDFQLRKLLSYFNLMYERDT